MDAYSTLSLLELFSLIIQLMNTLADFITPDNRWDDLLITGRGLLLHGARGLGPRVVDLLLPVRTAAGLVLPGGRLCDHQGDVEGPGGRRLLLAPPLTRGGPAGHLHHQAARPGLGRQVRTGGSGP